MCWKRIGMPAYANWRRSRRRPSDKIPQNSADLLRSSSRQLPTWSNDFPRVWRDPRTSDRDRKRMVRLLLEDVTLLQQQEVITAHVRFKGGSTRDNHRSGRAVGGATHLKLLVLIDQLLEDYTDARSR